MNCACCESPNCSRYRDYAWNLWGTQYRLAQCGNCGVVFTDPLPTDEAVAQLYAEAFAYEWYSEHLLFKRWDARQRVGEYRDYVKRDVLDYGGGKGYLAQAFAARGIRSEVYDPYAGHAELSKPRWGTVVCLHTLEHANDLSRTVRQLRDRLDPDGRIIVAVPNAQGLGYAMQQMAWVWAQPPLTHVYHFTERGLRRLLERHGFRVDEVSFAERWDANLVADIIWDQRTRRWEADWARCAGPGWRRRWVTFRNGLARNFALRLCRNETFPANQRSELTVFASVAA